MTNGRIALQISFFTTLILSGLSAFFSLAYAAPQAQMLKPFASLNEQSKHCAACHKEQNPALYQQWGRSKHCGANIGCYECHQADANDPDAIKHEGFNISMIVSPKDCGRQKTARRNPCPS